jgi:hypothetical protein
MPCSDMHRACLVQTCMLSTIPAFPCNASASTQHWADTQAKRQLVVTWHPTTMTEDHLKMAHNCPDTYRITTTHCSISVEHIQAATQPPPAVAARHAAQCCNTSNHKSITNFVELSTTATANAAAQHLTAKQSTHSCALQHSPSCACVHASDPYKPDGPAGAMPICPNTTCAHPAGALA